MEVVHGNRDLTMPYTLEEAPWRTPTPTLAPDTHLVRQLLEFKSVSLKNVNTSGGPSTESSASS